MGNPVKKLMRVTPGIGLNIRTGPSISYTKIGAMMVNTQIWCNEEEGGWYKHEKGGWSCGEYLALIKDETPPETTPSEPIPPEDVETEDDYSYKYDEKQILGLFTFETTSADAIFDELRVVHALPFQFLETTDTRPEHCAYGRKFLDTIINEGSFIYMIPGKAKFFKGASKDSRNGIMANFLNVENKDESVDSLLSTILQGEQGRYYSFESDYANYVPYVNAMARLGSHFTGLANTTGYNDKTKYKAFDWFAKNDSDFIGNMTQNPIIKDINNNYCLCMYADGNQTSYSESLSNSAESSMMEGLINKGSEAIKEFRYVFGDLTTSDEDIYKTSSDNYEQTVNSILSKLKFKQSGLGQVMNQFKDYGSTLVNGGNVILPDVYRDSSFGRSYSLEFKLFSPYGDIESIYLHVLIPLFHLYALAFPRQLGRSGYTSPFLVRAFCKGWFNCDMGIVESINIKKAAQDGWNIDGLPTEIDVSVSLRDLYSVIAIGSAKDYSHLNNTEYLDMIGTLCGININKPDLDRKIGIMAMYLTNKIKDTPKSIGRQIEQNVLNKIHNLLK